MYICILYLCGQSLIQNSWSAPAEVKHRARGVTRSSLTQGSRVRKSDKRPSGFFPLEHIIRVMRIHGMAFFFPKVHFRCKAFASVFFSVFQSFYFCAVVVLPYFCLSSKISPKTGWKRASRFPLFPTMRVDVKIKLILYQIFLKTKMVESLK